MPKESDKNIRNIEYYQESLWDWTPYNECFGSTKIRMTDIDGFVERKGRFLVVETKRPSIPIPKGQKIMFDSMIKTGLFYVLIIWGEANQPETAQWYNGSVFDTNTGNLKERISRWFYWADKQEEYNND